MKKLFLLLICPAVMGLSTLNVKGQIGVGTSFTGTNAGKFEQVNLDRLKASTLIYIVRESENERVEELQKLYEQAWTYTPIKVIKLSELAEYVGKNEYSFLTVDGYMKEKTEKETGFTQSQHCFYYLYLWMVDEKNPTKKNGDINQVPFARIELNVRWESRNNIEKGNAEEWKKEMFDFLYEKNTIVPNWHPGFVKCYLQTLNNAFSKGKTRWMYENVKNTSEMAKVKSSTLYVPEYLLRETFKKPPEDLFKKYPYKYKLIPDTELSDLMIAGEKPIYALLYLSTPYENYLYIVNSKTGEIVYNQYNPMNFVLKEKHIKELAE